jgi:hypothetical protein
MPTNYKNAQVQGTSSVSTYATLYTPPSATQSVLSQIAICNTAATQATYRIAIMTSAGTPAAANWLCYDTVVPANDTAFIGGGFGIANGDYIRVSSSANTVAFTASVSEIS